MEFDEIVFLCVLFGLPVLNGLFFVGLSAYYRAKYVRGTRGKFKIQIEQVLERNKIDVYSKSGLVEDLTELISGDKEINNEFLDKNTEVTANKR